MYATLKDNLIEVLCVLHFSKEARDAYRKALKAYNRAGRPPQTMFDE